MTQFGMSGGLARQLWRLVRDRYFPAPRVITPKVPVRFNLLPIEDPSGYDRKQDCT